MVKTFGEVRRQDLVPGPARRPGMLTVYPLAGRAGLRFEGEADLTVQPQIREALTALPPAAKIHLDLAGLNFIDTGCARELIALTWQPPYPRLILHDPPPCLLRIIGLLWPEANVEFDPSPGKTADHGSGGATATGLTARRRPAGGAQAGYQQAARGLDGGWDELTGLSQRTPLHGNPGAC